MTCTKAQLLALLNIIEKEIARSKSIREALERVGRIKHSIEVEAEAEVFRELGLVF